MLLCFISCKSCSSHLSFKFLFTSFALMLNWSFLETMLDTTSLFSLVLIEFAKPTISLAISSEFLLPGKSLVPT